MARSLPPQSSYQLSRGETTEKTSLYGEFDSTRAHLAGFYQRRGFQVLALGERLDLSDVMGTQTLVGAAERTDQLGVMALT